MSEINKITYLKLTGYRNNYMHVFHSLNYYMKYIAFIHDRGYFSWSTFQSIK